MVCYLQQADQSQDQQKRRRSLFVYFWLTSAKMVQHIEAQNNGGAVPLLNLGIIRRLPVPCPPLPTQQRIAGILSAYDDLIENNRRRIGLLEQAARLLYREWFVHLRFPAMKRQRSSMACRRGGKEKSSRPSSAFESQAQDKERRIPEIGVYPCVDQGQAFIGDILITPKRFIVMNCHSLYSEIIRGR